MLALDITATLDTPAPGLPPADIDADLICDDWERLFATDLSAPPGDTDRDGLALLLEHALNTDPGKPDPSPLKITRNPDGTLTLRFPRNRELPFIELLVEESQSLATGTWSPATPTSTTSVLCDGLTEQLTLTFAHTGDTRYFRLRASSLPDS